MAYWLLKGDPDDYGYPDLERDRTTVWSGVRNPQALSYLRGMQKGDALLIYHTGGEKAIVGLAEVSRNPYVDPDAEDERFVVVEIRAKQRLPRPVSLSAIKADKSFADFVLVRNSRLSVMPVTPQQWAKLLDMAGAANQVGTK